MWVGAWLYSLICACKINHDVLVRVCVGGGGGVTHHSITLSTG